MPSGLREGLGPGEEGLGPGEEERLWCDASDEDRDGGAAACCWEALLLLPSCRCVMSL